MRPRKRASAATRRRVMRAWWSSRSSKPQPRHFVPGGRFDSYPLRHQLKCEEIPIKQDRSFRTVENNNQDSALNTAMPEGACSFELAVTTNRSIPKPSKRIPGSPKEIPSMSTSFTDLSVWETQYIDTFFIAATVLRGKFGRDG